MYYESGTADRNASGQPAGVAAYQFIQTRPVVKCAGTRRGPTITNLVICMTASSLKGKQNVFIVVMVFNFQL